ncbi:MAG: hypothetical protein P4L79_03700 [Legionella sp.]|uniref:hypothetical protein n=1 Tax=Legionella sp. TaxID=459 RepID=UPI00283E4594|nr:hypothetical protein [Legionella sp.]
MPFTNDQIKTLNELLPPQSAEHLIECCVYLENEGFTPEQLLRVAKAGGNQAIEMLKDLILIHISDEQILIDEETGLPWTHLSTLLYAGFSREQLIAVLSNNGGSKNLHALQNLLQPVPLDDGEQTTQLQLLVATGFSADQLIAILNNIGGSKNLHALLDLLQFVPLNDGQQTTQLQLLVSAGFGAEQLIAVLSHSGGAKNLQALQDLLQLVPLADGQQITQLQLLAAAGFNGQQLIAVLSHNGGSNNLHALQNLLQPVLLNDGQQTTQLQLLTATGFSASQLIAVVGHIGGSKNLAALISLAHHDEIRAMMTNYKKGCEIIINLAQGDSRSAHLGFLFNILSIQAYREYIVDQGILEYICKGIKPKSAKAITQLQVNSIDELILLCPQPKSQGVRAKTGKRTGKKSASTQTPSAEHQNLEFIDTTLPQLDSAARKRSRVPLESQGFFKKSKRAETVVHSERDNDFTTNNPM